MGMKYMLHGFNYPYNGYEETRQTDFIIVAIILFVYMSLTYDGVDFSKRG